MDTHSTCTPSNSFKTTLLRPMQINDVFLYICSRSKVSRTCPPISLCVSISTKLSPNQIIQTFPSLFTCSRHTNLYVLRHPIPLTLPNYIFYSRLNPRERPQNVGTYTVVIWVPTTQHLDYAPRLLSRAMFVVAGCLRCECARLWDCLCVVACWYVYIRQYAGRSRVIGVYTFVCVRFFVCPCRVVV